MKHKIYKSTKNNEIVMEEEALDYVLEKLGIELKETTNEEQEEFKQMIVEWFFSGNWIKEELEKEVI